jgi:hypothetical protein
MFTTEPIGGEVAAGGHAVGFTSKRQLTGYDNNLLSGECTKFHGPACTEVYVYNADSERIFCVSCDPSGAPPVAAASVWSTVGTPGLIASESEDSGVVFVERWINAAGTEVFFMSSQPLVPGDHNVQQNVYEWESDGAGGCARVAGCITAISDVSSPNPAYFVDASSSGDDVFFTQSASLVPRAIDETLKLYDARVNGGFPETSQACEGTGCQGPPPAPPIFATPSSVTFNGTGNYSPPPPLKPKKVTKKTVKCKRGFVKNRKGKCVKKTKKKSRARKASSDRRAHS